MYVTETEERDEREMDVTEERDEREMDVTETEERGQTDGGIGEDLLTEDELRDLQEQLSQIELPGSGHREPLPPDNDIEFPSSYKTNSRKERILLDLAENFCRQYAHLYPDRKPLFTCPQNECGVEKFVCTTLRPTLLPYPELYSWDGCARFVSEYLVMQPLHPPLELPRMLLSSSTALRRQQGSCFDFSVLLCSLLLGAGYDAYCVSGYATREMCLMDESRDICPLLQKPKEIPGEPPVKHHKKYSVKAPRQLISNFEVQQNAKQQEKIQQGLRRQRQEEEQRLADAEQPGPDPLYGLRVHCWVLVLCGKREVPEDFFIDALTGKSFQTKDEHFLGVESVWNHENYWVNMQDCRHACKDMRFDLADPLHWEYMLLSASKPLLLTPNAEQEDEEEDEDPDQDTKPVLQMPPSWVLPIVITPKDFETRCPQGKKVLQYKKTKLEKWAPYLQRDGLVSRLSLYLDSECSQVVEIQDWFQNRQDKLDMRRRETRAGVTSEYFSPGRSDALKVHVFQSMAPESERRMVFYSESRLDGLKTRDEKATEMTETFQGRSDFLYYRHTLFRKRPKKVAIAGGPAEANPRPILKVTERFHRNEGKAANEDVAERTFLLTEDRIQLRSHRADDRITTSSWDFLKPPNLGEKGARVTLTPETCASYQVEPREAVTKQLYMYETLIRLQRGELDAKEAVRRSEAEVLKILAVRTQEEACPRLTVSIYDTERNEKSKEQREAMERAQREDSELRAMLELDYLAPYLAQLGDPVKLNRAQAQQVKEDCLRDLKQRLIEQANLIQARFEKETQELQKKQQWYQQNQLSMAKEDEESYLDFCSEAMFRIHILETRLNRHKDLAPKKYLALEDQLNKDPRLSEQLLSS
ncbi:dynein regulatory complex subunit 7 [Spea bombifrons]|uniref:dynein regulatory complex subunit 7 n=1 Tax=Spea bombifrons TaxID=233779 RepID=UPI002348F78D|nr:dynein regulatory complex subunit 7 [Spea bombifrons]